MVDGRKQWQRAMVEGREVEQRGESDNKRERTMAKRSAQFNARGEKTMEREKN
jgi:hypothetical protein